MQIMPYLLATGYYAVTTYLNLLIKPILILSKWLLRRLWSLLGNWLTRHVLSSCDCSWYVVWACVALLWTSIRSSSLAVIRPYRKQVHFCHLMHLRSSQRRMRDWCRSSSGSSSSDRAALAAAASKDGIVTYGTYCRVHMLISRCDRSGETTVWTVLPRDITPEQVR